MTLRRAAKSLRACFSFRGHDFEELGNGPTLKREMKRTTRRARRKLDRALAQSEVS